MPEAVVRRKLALVRNYLDDLKPFEGISPEEFSRHHYAIERLVQVIIDCCADTVSHVLSSRGVVPPDSYRETFFAARDHGVISAELAERLANAAGMRNILVHQYDRIDDRVVMRAVAEIIRDGEAIIERFA